MPRIALGLQYNGHAFQGWQSQVHGQTVQDTLQKALSQFATIPIQVQCAGRTDTGVHALEQIVHFDVGLERDIHAWVRGTNTYLPETIAVRWACEVSPEFHARFDAFQRTYHYVIYNHPIRSPIWTGRAGWYHKPLDAQKMHKAAQILVGEHDFSAFRASECQANSPIKTMHQIKVERFGDCVLVSVTANAFLHHMVRNIVGSLIYIGSGKQSQEWLGFLLEQKNRALSAPTFSPAGLYLSAIHYPEAYDLPTPRDDFLQALGLK
ncbi:MAG: tRNA pseudouridine(38-40) synthase TruA [Burkholderiales bacterium]|nr:tRNA pseudouridine(38-40) synthase TruA [Burkholderiales bacterium]